MGLIESILRGSVNPLAGCLNRVGWPTGWAGQLAGWLARWGGLGLAGLGLAGRGVAGLKTLTVAQASVIKLAPHVRGQGD